jgi:DNA-binding MarR family transcriptional regulator
MQNSRRLFSSTLNFVRALRELNAEMPMQQAHILLYVASNPGITMADLAKETQLAQSSCSRSVAALSKFKGLGTPGLNLVEAAIDPHEPRRRILFLTDEGRTYITKIMKLLDEAFILDNGKIAREEIERAHSEAMAASSPTGVAKSFKPKK